LKNIFLHNKQFEVFISKKEIESAVERIANSMNRDLAGKNPLFISLLNGAFMFTSDLLKKLNFNSNLSFIRLSSYNGFQTTGKINQVLGLTESIEDRTVVVLEDIIDTGTTLNYFLRELNSMKPAEIKVATMFFKPDACMHAVQIDYLGLKIPNDFVVGYGLDYDGLGRNYEELYRLKVNTNK
jgi:hypoxanthine phosphoribosyltransferase